VANFAAYISRRRNLRDLSMGGRVMHIPAQCSQKVCEPHERFQRGVSVYPSFPLFKCPIFKLGLLKCFRAAAHIVFVCRVLWLEFHWLSLLSFNALSPCINPLNPPAGTRPPSTTTQSVVARAVLLTVASPPIAFS